MVESGRVKYIRNQYAVICSPALYLCEDYRGHAGKEDNFGCGVKAFKHAVRVIRVIRVSNAGGSRSSYPRSSIHLENSWKPTGDVGSVPWDR